MTYDSYQRMEKMHDELSKIEKSIEGFSKYDDKIKEVEGYFRQSTGMKSIMGDLGLSKDSDSIMKDLGLVSDPYRGIEMISLLERCNRIDRNIYNLSKSVMNDEKKIEEVSRFWRKANKVLSMVDEEYRLFEAELEKEHSDCDCLDE